MLEEGGGSLFDQIPAFSHLLKFYRRQRIAWFFPATGGNHVMGTLAPSVGGGGGEFWEGALPRGRPPERAGPAAQPFKTS